MNKSLQKKTSAWGWIPTLYFAQGLPYAVVTTLAVVLYKRLGVSNTDIALYTGWLYLPWVIKPLWSPFVDLLQTKRWWVLTMQGLVGAGLAGVALTLPVPHFFRWSLAVFWLVAFSSATHDIAADGFYMEALDVREQSFYVGIRSTFYRVATLAGQGLVVILAGTLENRTGKPVVAWMATFFLLGALFVGLRLYHQWALPRPSKAGTAASVQTAAGVWKAFRATVTTFFQKRQAGVALLFMLFYRFPEAQLVKLINPFLLDPVEQGGLGLTTEQVGWVYGTVGVVGLTLGGILGGWCASRGGLRRWLWPMAWSLSLTCLTFVYLGYAQPRSLALIGLCVFVEQAGYGFGFTAYMLYLMYYSAGPYQTAHYAFCTAFMALGMMLPGMAAGWLQEQMGYAHFFVWVMLCCLVTIAVCAFVRIDPAYGRSAEEAPHETNEKEGGQR